MYPVYFTQAVLIRTHIICRRSTASFRRKLFGHEQQEGYDDNIITQDQSKDHVRVHPLSAFKRYWDLAIVIMVAYTVVVLPVRCAFSWDYYHALDAGHNIFHQLAVSLARDLLSRLICYGGLPASFLAHLAACFGTSNIDQSLSQLQKTLPELQVDWTLGTDLLIDLFFMADIALNFNTGFISDQASFVLVALLSVLPLLPSISTLPPTIIKQCLL